MIFYKFLFSVILVAVVAGCAYNPNSDPGPNYWAGVAKEVKHANVR